MNGGGGGGGGGAGVRGSNYPKIAKIYKIHVLRGSSPLQNFRFQLILIIFFQKIDFYPQNQFHVFESTLG